MWNGSSWDTSYWYRKHKFKSYLIFAHSLTRLLKSCNPRNDFPVSIPGFPEGSIYTSHSIIILKSGWNYLILIKNPILEHLILAHIILGYLIMRHLILERLILTQLSLGHLTLEHLVSWTPHSDLENINLRHMWFSLAHAFALDRLDYTPLLTNTLYIFACVSQKFHFTLLTASYPTIAHTQPHKKPSKKISSCSRNLNPTKTTRPMVAQVIWLRKPKNHTEKLKWAVEKEIC